MTYKTCCTCHEQPRLKNRSRCRGCFNLYQADLKTRKKLGLVAHVVSSWLPAKGEWFEAKERARGANAPGLVSPLARCTGMGWRKPLEDKPATKHVYGLDLDEEVRYFDTQAFDFSRMEE